MQRKIITTADGSNSIEIPGMDESYHSKFGAIQESQHVYINAGLKPLLNTTRTIDIFEMGFGTGLNALLTLMEAEKQQQEINYEAIELFPLEDELISQLNYCEQLQRPDLKEIFERLHSYDWDKEINITAYFSLKKINASMIDYPIDRSITLVYYDAFAPNVQPELWQSAIFGKLFHRLSDDGVLVTYSSKGEVRRAMQSAGFIVEKLPGSPGKREMLRASKTNRGTTRG